MALRGQFVHHDFLGIFSRRQVAQRKRCVELVYVWADGIYSGLRGSDDRLCVLAVIGANALGEKHFLAIEDGVRDSTQSWR